MAETFKLKTIANVDITIADTIYTTPATTQTIILGLAMANKSSNVVKVTLTLESDTIDTTETNVDITLLHEISIPQNATLEVLSGQKLALQTTDVLKIISDTADAVDVALSVLEIS
tara:strand:+ start:2658 stop:3005 length:348 start_codon:yes stop_codon:yes gene_type:complete